MNNNNDLIIHPCITVSDARNILKTLYGISTALQVKLLSSYGDQNFYVQIPPPSSEDQDAYSKIHRLVQEQMGSEEYQQDTYSKTSPKTQQQVQKQLGSEEYPNTCPGTPQRQMNLEEMGSSEFVLKVINSEDSLQEELIETRAKLMVFSKERGVSCPVPVRNIKGEFVSLEKVFNGLCEDDDGDDNDGDGDDGGGDVIDKEGRICID